VCVKTTIFHGLCMLLNTAFMHASSLDTYLCIWCLSYIWMYTCMCFVWKPVRLIKASMQFPGLILCNLVLYQSIFVCVNLFSAWCVTNYIWSQLLSRYLQDLNPIPYYPPTCQVACRISVFCFVFFAFSCLVHWTFVNSCDVYCACIVSIV